MQLHLIAAVASNGVIGRDGRLPWRIPEDLQRFKALTMGHPVIMGRKTWESLPGALPGRLNIVLSRRGVFVRARDEPIVVPSLDDALAYCEGRYDTAFVIGGAEVYRAALPRADVIHMTRVQGNFVGDTRFPLLDEGVWVEVTRVPRTQVPPEELLTFAYVTYARRVPQRTDGPLQAQG